MNQLKLFDTSPTHSAELASMKMTFDACEQWGYMGMVEINSNKFWIMFDADEYDHVDNFEIVSAKWYFELNLGIIKLVRNIVRQLYTRHCMNNMAAVI